MIVRHCILARVGGARCNSPQHQNTSRKGKIMSEHIDAAVQRLIEAHSGGPAITKQFIAVHPLSIGEALQVRERVQAALGPIGGWKIAPGSTIENPSFSAISSADIYSSPARVAYSRFRCPG